MTTPYIDPNLIFAENAPTQDKPAAFENYDKGMDETRKNEGRPTIKQFNFIQQQNDLKNRYIHENGAALPYKEGIAYEENAVVVKDGILQQWKGGVWKSAIESELANKADKAATYTKLEVDDALNLKADKTYVDTVRDENIRFYQTLTEANADIANLAVNQAIQVGEADNGGLWYKATAGATSLTKSAYDPLTQAKADATAKANAAEENAKADATAKANAVKSYTDSIVSTIDFSAPVMTGQDIYDKSLTTNKVFSAVWSEYNKPVWHIGNSVFVDAVGATVKVVKQEFVMTYKLTEENQTVRVPTTSKDSSTTYVDWGDGTANYVDRSNSLHTYTNAIGDEFVITVTGELEVFNVPVSYAGDRTADCIKSIDKNTLPKTTSSFNVKGCVNLESLCDGAFSSLAGDNLNLELYKNAPNVTYGNNLFAGLQNVKNIDNLFGLVSGVDNTGIAYSPELFKYFTSVTSARNLFLRYKGNLTKEHLEAMTELQYAYRLFAQADGIESSDILTHQTKLIDVNQCFYLAKSDTVSALPIYEHLLNNNPNLTNYAECFKFAALQNMGSIPAEWK